MHEAEGLSNHFSRVPLGEIAEIVSGFGFPKELQGKMEGDLPFFKVGDISKAWKQGQRLLTKAEHYISKTEAVQIRAKSFPSGTLVFAKIGEAIKLNRRAILGQPSIVDNNVMGLIPRQSLVDTLYLYYYMLTVKLGDISQATTVPSVRKSDVEDIGFPLLPIQAQQAIVAEIEKQFSRLDEAVANLRRVKANLKRYKAAVLKAAVEGKLTEDWRKQHPDVEPASKLLERILTERKAEWKGRGEYKEPAELETTNLPKIPKGWVWTTIAQIADVASGNTPSGVLGAVKQTGDIPWFKVGDMNHDENQQVMRHAEAWLSVAEVKGLGLRLFQPNTMLFPKRGGAIATNKKRRLDSPGCADLNVMGITPHHNIASYFFNWFGGVDLGQLSDGSNVPQINHKDIEPLAVPLPPLAEQQAIIPEVECRLSIIEELDAVVEANITRADRLRQSILQQAFSGKLPMRGMPDVSRRAASIQWSVQ